MGVSVSAHVSVGVRCGGTWAEAGLGAWGRAGVELWECQRCSEDTDACQPSSRRREGRVCPGMRRPVEGSCAVGPEGRASWTKSRGKPVLLKRGELPHSLTFNFLSVFTHVSLSWDWPGASPSAPLTLRARESSVGPVLGTVGGRAAGLAFPPQMPVTMSQPVLDVVNLP